MWQWVPFNTLEVGQRFCWEDEKGQQKEYAVLLKAGGYLICARINKNPAKTVAFLAGWRQVEVWVDTEESA